MAETDVDGDGVDIPLEVSEADLLEQQTPVDSAGDPSVDRPGADSAATEADDADRWEQQQSVPLADDDYPSDAGEPE